MSTDVARASHDWLTLREPADSAARSADLVTALLPMLPLAPLTIHDLGCGTGSMRRWLSPQLPQQQHWIEHDRDVDLLARDPATTSSSTGQPVSFETRESDITRIAPSELSEASLLTASALLDMFTEDELTRFVQGCFDTGRPSLLTLSVVGRVSFDPADDLDALLTQAFNDHQRRTTTHGTLLGPDAADVAIEQFTSLGADVLVRLSPWQLNEGCASLLTEWFDGWIGAAGEQQPELRDASSEYAVRRLDEAAQGRLRVRVQHVDILVRP